MHTKVAAQEKIPLHFKSLTINDGLSQGFVSAITQDNLGLMWFTTSDGLNKYDGYRFTIYHHDADDSASIGSDDLTYVFEDAQKRLWIGTRNNGLDFFDRENNVFYHIRHTIAENLISNKITFICKDKTGALLINTDQGIDRMQLIPKNHTENKSNNFFDNYELKFTHLKFGNNTLERKDANLQGNILTDSRGHTFIMSGPYVYELIFNQDDTYTVTKKCTVPLVDTTASPGMLEDTSSYSLFLNGEEIIRFPGYDFNLPHRVYINENRVPNHTWTIDRNQMLWSAENGGINRIYIPTDERWFYIPADSSQRDALRNIISIFSDRQGILWIGTAGYGILKYDPEIELFHHILPNTIHYQLLEIKPGQITTRNFDKISLNKNYQAHLKNDAFMQVLKERFVNNNIIYYTKDTSGNLWIPLQNHIYYYNLKTKEKKSYEVLVNNEAGEIYPLYADKKNNLWMGYKQYFVHFAPSSNTFSKFVYPLHLSNYETDFLQAIYEDGNILWLGSIHGLFRFDIIKQQMTHAYYVDPDDTSSLSNNYIFSFCSDIKNPQQYLWIGTKGGGLNRLDKYTGKFIRYTNKNGLANNVVYGILPGDDGNLWLSTNRGLSAFNPDTKIFRNFDVNDGLQSNEFNRYAYCKTTDGLLVFGGMNGINYFDPKEIKPLEPPDLVFTDLRLFNKPVNLTEPNSPLQKSINYADRVILQYNQNVITFQFAAVDYRRQGSILYRYKMEGFDKDWIYSGTAHEATYTNLDPGDYRFIIQASFETELWGNKEKSIIITVMPPWYRTWWFYIFSILSISSTIYGLYLFRLSHFKMLEKLRNRIAMDLHDEVGSSISTIAIYSKIMREQIGSVDFDNEPLVNKINDFAAEIMESMNDIVWSVNTKNDAFERIISRLREHASQLLEVKGYIIRFDFDVALNHMKMGMEKRREFYLIYKEAVNNIAKYAEGKNAWISLALISNTLLLTIKDDGKGFERNKIKNSGNGIVNMQHRAEMLRGKLLINSQPGKGTEIILSFNVT